MYISIILYIYISIIIIYYYHYYIIISSIILLLLLLLLLVLLLLYNYYKFFIVFLYKVLWATHSIRVIQGLYHVIYFVSVDHTCHTYGQACPRALIWAFSLLAIADYRTLDTAQTVYDCVHTHLEKKMCKANVWSTLGVLVTVQSDCRGWKAKPWSRCQKSSWNNLDARSLTLKNSFHCYVSFQLQRENSSFVKMDESQSYIVHICATSLRDTEDLAWTYCASRRVVMVLGVFDRLDTVVMQTGTSIKNH